MSGVRTIINKKTGIRRGEHGSRVFGSIVKETELILEEPRVILRRTVPRINLFASTYLTQINDLNLFWSAWSFFKDDFWHIGSSVGLAVDSINISLDQWSIPIVENLPEKLGKINDVLEYLVEKAKTHLNLAQAIDVENPLSSTPYQSLYSSILELHTRITTIETRVGIEEEIETVWREFRQIRDALHPKEFPND